MPKITLTDLISVMTKVAGPKATKVAQLKNRDTYDPATDFYKAFRDRLIDLHRKGLDRTATDGISGGLTDPKKIKAYPAMVDGYKKWWGRKEMKWFSPPSTTYSSDGVSVSIAPELGLEISGTRHVIKLHMSSSEELTKTRADLITAFMQETLKSGSAPGTIFAVIDVRKAKLFVAPAPGGRNLLAMMNAELSYIAKLWPEI